MATDAPSTVLPDGMRADVEVLWDYHQMGHQLRPVDVAIGLGSHDLGVANHAADLYHQGLFPLIVFSGANAPTTVDRFPRGEAVHYRDHTVDLGVPAAAVLVEPAARNTAQNIELTRRVLDDHGIAARSAVLISRPYQQRRAWATAAKVWPELDAVCSSRPLSLDDYIADIGDVDRVINMVVGDTQRIWAYADKDFAVPQHVPQTVDDAYQRLVDAGYTDRLI